MAERFPGVNLVIDHMAMIDINTADSDGFAEDKEWIIGPNRAKHLSVRLGPVLEPQAAAVGLIQNRDRKEASQDFSMRPAASRSAWIDMIT